MDLSTPFRRALFPDIEPDDYRAFARRMHAQARDEWKRLIPPSVPELTPRIGNIEVHRSPGPAPAASLIVSWRTSTPGGSLGRRVSLPAAPPIVMPGWLRITAAAVAAVSLVVAGLCYHPPRLVVTPGRPIDVMADIRINGVAAPASHGRYLLLWVRTNRPNLINYLIDTVRGDATLAVARHTHAEDRTAERSGRKAYLDSQHAAAVAASTVAHLDPRRVSVVIRDRGFVGPSAGLVYALAITDLLRRTDSTGGRVVAATGSIDSDGRVSGVGWVPVKARGASQAGANVLFVPEEDAALANGAAPTVIGVSSLREAEQALTRGF
jgi:PDZ domain-containing protein